MWTQRLTERFVKDGVVTPDNAEIVRYGLEALADNVLAFLLTAAFALLYRPDYPPVVYIVLAVISGGYTSIFIGV